jgi:hypothetical protein
VDDDTITLEEKRRQLHALEELESSIGWRLLKTQLLEVARQFSGQVLNSPLGADGVYAQEFAKGRINGIAFSIDMLETTIGSLTMDVREAEKKAEETDDDEDYDAEEPGPAGEFAP